MRAAAPHLTLPRWKKLLFAAFTTTLVLLAMEAVLAAFGLQPLAWDQDPFVGFAGRSPLFVPREDEQGHVIMHTARPKLAFFNTQSFPRHKTPGTRRIFCVGGSTTFGQPYEDSTSYAGWLRELLPMAHPQQRWEVINAGGISYASYRVVRVMEELCRYSPDLFVVYTGHNEFLEERTYRRVRTMPRVVRQLNGALVHTRIYRLAHALLRPGGEKTDRPLLPDEVDARLDHAAGPADYQRDELLRQQVAVHFEFNVLRMIELAQSAGANIIFVAPAANWKDFSPFKSEPAPGLKRTAHVAVLEALARAARLADDKRWSDAQQVLEAALRRDPRYAETYYRLGHVLFAQGQFAAARRAWQRAVDEDVCPLRAITPLRDAIVRVARKRGVPIVMFDEVLQHDCLHHFGHPHPGREYFLDHVHPHPSAHRLLALALIEAMVQQRQLSPPSTWREEAVAVATQRIAGRLDGDAQTRALINLAQVLSWAGKQKEAGPLALHAVQRREQLGLQDDPEGLYYAAVHAAMTGSNEQAITLFDRLLKIVPDHGEARWRMAAVLYDQGRLDEALNHYRQASDLRPEDATIKRMIQLLLDRKEEQQHAISD